MRQKAFKRHKAEGCRAEGCRAEGFFYLIKFRNRAGLQKFRLSLFAYREKKVRTEKLFDLNP